MDEAATLITLLAGAGTAAGAAHAFKVPRLLRDWKAFRAWRAATASGTAVDAETYPPTVINQSGQVLRGPVACLQGAGQAMATPPPVDQSLRELARLMPSRRYRIPLGWYVNATHEPRLVRGALIGDVNHVLISGQSDAGKDNVARNLLFSLAAQHTPDELQVCILDGKGLDWSDWRGKAHTWGVACQPEEIKPLMEQLSAERKRRLTVLDGKVKKWEDYQGGDLPLLVVFVSELLLLKAATGDRALEAWLSAELTSARAFGIRYIIATQTFSNFGTQWRMQINCVLAGYQPHASQDQPNTNLPTDDIAALGALPPSRLPSPQAAPGVFTMVAGQQAATVRFPFVTDAENTARLDAMPNAASAVSVPAQRHDAAEHASQLPQRVVAHSEENTSSSEKQTTLLTNDILVKRLADAEAKLELLEQSIDALIEVALVAKVAPTTIAKQIRVKYKTACERVGAIKENIQLKRLLQHEEDVEDQASPPVQASVTSDEEAVVV